MNTRQILISLMAALPLHAAAQAREVRSAPVGTPAYGIIQMPDEIPQRSTLAVKFTVVNTGQNILNARYTGCFVEYEVRDLNGKLVLKSRPSGCLKSTGGFSVLNQADYPFLEPFLVNTHSLGKGQYQVVVRLKVDGRIGTRPVKSISSAPVLFAVR